MENKKNGCVIREYEVLGQKERFYICNTFMCKHVVKSEHRICVHHVDISNICLCDKAKKEAEENFNK